LACYPNVSLHQLLFPLNCVCPPPMHRDAVEACSTARSPEEREQCFLNFGLSSAAIDRYYEPVMKMEEAIVDQSSEGEDWMGTVQPGLPHAL
jgi:hypothetical protein